LGVHFFRLCLGCPKSTSPVTARGVLNHEEVEKNVILNILKCALSISWTDNTLTSTHTCLIN